MTEKEMQEYLQSHYPKALIEVQGDNKKGGHRKIKIKCSSFKNKSRLQRHQEIMKLFKESLACGDIHALSIEADPLEEEKIKQ